MVIVDDDGGNGDDGDYYNDDGGGGDRVCGDGSKDDDHISLDFCILKTLYFNLVIHHAYICIQNNHNYVDKG